MKKNGFVATSVLYSLVAILSIVMLIIINNYSTSVKTNRKESENIKEDIYDNSADILFTWNYVGEWVKPTDFPQPGTGYKITSVTCNGGTGQWNEGQWTAEVSIASDKVRCVITVDDE